jgi:hypothetical protein
MNDHTLPTPDLTEEGLWSRIPAWAARSDSDIDVPDHANGMWVTNWNKSLAKTDEFEIIINELITRDGATGTCIRAWFGDSEVYISDPDHALEFARAIMGAADALRNIRDGIDRASREAEWQQADRIAEETACGLEGCDGSWHEAGVAAEDWSHKVFEEKFGLMEANIIYDPARTPCFFAYIDADGSHDGEDGSLQVRELASLYDGLSAWIRKVADEVDHRNSELAA